MKRLLRIVLLINVSLLAGYCSTPSFLSSTPELCRGFEYFGHYELDKRETIKKMLMLEKGVDFDKMHPIVQKKLEDSLDLSFLLRYNDDCTWSGSYKQGEEIRSGKGTYKVLEKKADRLLIKMDEEGYERSLVERTWVSSVEENGIRLDLIGSERGESGIFIMKRK